jgi:hypothetical protein
VLEKGIHRNRDRRDWGEAFFFSLLPLIGMKIGGAGIEAETEKGSAPADFDSAWLSPVFGIETRLRAGADLEREKDEAGKLSVRGRHRLEDDNDHV